MIIDGKQVASQIEANIKQAISHLKDRRPGLAFIRVGKNPASILYVNMKKKKCGEVGIYSIDVELSENVSEEILLREITQLNQNPLVDGILVQLPLPPHLSPYKVFEAIDPKKDVDGFHPLNMGKLLLGEKGGFYPCTPYGIYILLHHLNLSLTGKHVVILGRSNIVGKPLAGLLIQKEVGANATVTVANSATHNLKQICLSADVLVAAMGSPHMVKAEMVKPQAIVIDVGITKVNGKILGDVDFNQVAPIASHITPVPGGVGPMTIAMLLSNTLLSFQKKGS